MTCRKCGHHFCWLCLGDQVAHGGRETDGYVNACYSVDEAIRRGRKIATAPTDGNTEQKEYDKIRIAHFAEWFNEHQRSVKFA